MNFLKTFEYLLCPTRDQRSLCMKAAGACRWIYNWGLAQRMKRWEMKEKQPTLYEQNNELTQLKEKEETCWLKEPHSQILQQALDDLNKSYHQLYGRIARKEKIGKLHFRCKGENDSFRYPQGVKIKENRVWLPKIGWVIFRKSREIEGELKQTTVIYKGDRWYVCFACEVGVKKEKAELGGVVGIDLGLEHFATIASEGIEEIPSPKFLKKRLLKIKYLSRRLSKKIKKGKNRWRAKKYLQKEHCRIQNKRKDWLHKLSTKVVKNHDTIVVENLAVKSLLEKSPRVRSRGISDSGWRSFLQMLEYKCKERCRQFLEMGRYFPSTKQCFKCKRLNDIPLEIREYRCNCGHLMHRDHNAALNLKAAGMSV